MAPKTPDYDSRVAWRFFGWDTEPHSVEAFPQYYPDFADMSCMAPETQTFSMALPAPTTPDCDQTVPWLFEWNTEPHSVEAFPQYYPDFADTRCMAPETQTFSMASPAPTTPSCDPTVAWPFQGDDAGTFPQYNFDVSWNMVENWVDFDKCILSNADFASWPYFGGTGEAMSINTSQESAKETATGLIQDQEGDPITRESHEGSKSTEDSVTTCESESREKRESPEELDWLEEFQPTKGPRPFEVQVGIARNVATTEISSLSKDSYESHGFTSQLNNKRPLIEREVEEILNVDIPSKGRKRNRSGSKSDEGVRR
ncbi:hypothetical protein ACLOAV_010208 [Pseudogymnoascus australis]